MADSKNDGVPQGLKPIDFIGFISTTKVVPCYKAPEMEFSKGARCESKPQILRLPSLHFGRSG